MQTSFEIVYMSAVAGGKLYVFGGSHPDSVMRDIHLKLSKEYLLSAPYNGVPNYRDAYCYEPRKNKWRTIRSLPLPMVSGAAVVLDDRYILLMGSSDTKTFRVGKTTRSRDPLWRGYGDVILCYDVQRDNYSRVGVLLYGVATCPWVTDGEHVYGFAGEPAHGYNNNTENVLQIGAIQTDHTGAAN